MRFEPYLGASSGWHAADKDAGFTVTPTFTGSGAEYFRIWIVNLMLTVATLGVYSAWAKTRRLQYFYRNTQLAGASFDFLGDPKAILRGRIMAVFLLAAWHFAFGFSVRFGIGVVAVLLFALPWLMRSALRFRLSSTVYRGLPFGFDGSARDAYCAYFPAVAALLVPGAIAALHIDKRYAGLSGLLYLFWPLMHAAMRRYQHRNLVYGDRHAGFALGKRQLAKPYAQLFFLVLGLGILFAIPVTLLSNVIFPLIKSAPKVLGIVVVVLGTLAIVLMGYVLFLVAGLYTTVRVDNLAWSATSFPGIRIVCDMKLRAYTRLQAVNVLLTLLTLGLYRPFAAVRTWRYRMAHVRIDAPDGFEQATLAAERPAVAAAGDGAADFLGLDISW